MAREVPTRAAWRANVELLLATSLDAVVAVDDDDRIVLFGDGAERAFDFRRAEIVGQPLELLLPERLPPRHREAIEALRARGTGGPMPVELVGRRRSGDTFPAIGTLSRVELEPGVSVALFVLRDLSSEELAARAVRDARREADAGAREAERAQRVLKTLLAFAPDGITIVEGPPDFPIVANSALATELLGRPEDGILGHAAGHYPGRFGLTKADGSAPSPSEMPLWRATHLGERIRGEEWSLARPDGRELTLLVNVEPVTSVDGTVVGAINCWRDITERKAEQNRRAADHAALQRREDELERAVAAREQVLGYVAHDLRTPLNAIQLHLHLLSHSSDLAPETRATVEGVTRAAQRMNRLVDDLLDVARADAGPLSIKREPVDLARLVVEAASSLRPCAASAGVSLDTQVGALPPVLGDRDRLLRVLDNLVGNAIKFSPASTTVLLRAFAENDAVVTVVEDTGIGLPPEDLAHVFDRFWQARQADPRGSGLGLTIARGIVEAHGGRIWAESLPGHGARFCFRLPTRSSA